MIPHTGDALRFLVQRLMSGIAPELSTSYALADLAMTSTLLGMIAQDFDRAAACRRADIDEMLPIFATAAERISDAALREDLREMRDTDAERDLRIESLDRQHAACTTVLITLHAHVESIDAPWARALDGNIWHYLERHAERHRYDVATG